LEIKKLTDRLGKLSASFQYQPMVKNNRLTPTEQATDHNFSGPPTSANGDGHPPVSQAGRFNAIHWIVEGKQPHKVYILGDGKPGESVLVRTVSGDGRIRELHTKDVYDGRNKVSLDRSCKLVKGKDGSFKAEPIGPRPIEITPAQHVAVKETIEALGNDPDLFSRGESLVTVIYEEEDEVCLYGGIELKSARGMMRSILLAQSVLGSCHISKHAPCFKFAKDKDTSKDIDPPKWLIASVHEIKHWHGIRHLHSLTKCPYVRKDGSLPWTGYDPVTGALYRPSVTIEKFPDRPSQEDARNANKQLRKLVSQFPFESEDDYAVWLAYLLNLIQRPVITGATPGFAFNGNKAGTGKGLLIDVGAIIAYGHCVPTAIYPSDKDEARKTKLALGLAGVAVVHFDNLDEGGFYGGGVVDSMLTSTVVNDRILGLSRDSGPVPLRPTWTLSGNNISPTKDSPRRWLVSNLITTLESPHRREDIEKTELRSYAADHRAELIRLALIILKAHALAGRPTNKWAPLGTYEGWDPIVRGAVWYATGKDCTATQQAAEQNSTEHINKVAFLQGLKEVDPHGSGRTAQDIFTAAEERVFTKKDGLTHLYPTLASALKSMYGTTLDFSKITCLLRSLKNDPRGGLKLEQVGTVRGGGHLWTVVVYEVLNRVLSNDDFG
jgi:hypothetical protein